MCHYQYDVIATSTDIEKQNFTPKTKDYKMNQRQIYWVGLLSLVFLWTTLHNPNLRGIYSQVVVCFWKLTPKTAHKFDFAFSRISKRRFDFVFWKLLLGPEPHADSSSTLVQHTLSQTLVTRLHPFWSSSSMSKTLVRFTQI